MPYNLAFLRKIRLPLSLVNYRKNTQSDLDIPIEGLKDFSLYNIILDTVAQNMFEEFFTATASQTAFTVSTSLRAKSGNNIPVECYRNGLKLKWVASGPTAGQFTYSGTTVTVSSSTVGDVIIVKY